MKRRKFLKTVGAATGVAALSACSTPRSKTAASKGIAQRGQTGTYRYLPPTPAKPKPPFLLPERAPGWLPDGADYGGVHSQRLFLEEVVGKTTDQQHMIPFGVYFKDEENPDADPKKWLLGSKIGDAGKDHFTDLVRAIAVRARQYNASLYRLRRLHFALKESDSTHWPRRNPHGDPPDPLQTTGNGFQDIVSAAEQDWITINNSFNKYLEDASQGVYF